MSWAVTIFIGQTVWRKVQQLGLATLYVDEDKVRFYVWHLLSMAHMPLEDHAEGLQVLEDDIQGFEDDSVRSPTSLRLFEQAQALHRYLLKSLGLQ